ncbi:MAG: hypothetical protein RLZZ444_2044 [Pseudomonadota bacterium]|jgi:hypothetical protein
MADLSFAQAVDALYRVLDMPAPLRPDLASGHHRIEFEVGDKPLSIALKLAPNGRAIIVEAGDPPRFADDRSVRQEQIRQVLMTALGLSATNRACVALKDSRDMEQPPALAVSARVALSHPLGQIGREMKLAIEDVIEQLEWQGAHLAAGGSSSGRGAPYIASGTHHANEEEFLVLRP